MTLHTNTIWGWAGRGDTPCQTGIDTPIKGDDFRVLRYENVPYATSNGSWLVFDGVIYNGTELCGTYNSQFSLHGSATEAKLLLENILKDGMQALHRINGNFAFAMWDAPRQLLLAARDRFGLHTLYWHTDGVAIAIGPRMFPLLDAVRGTRRMNYDSAVEFLLNGFTDQDSNTLLNDVYQLTPGSMLEFEPSSGALNVTNWYELPLPSLRTQPAQEAILQFLQLLANAIFIRSSNANKNGALMLSAGIDSSSIASFLKKQGMWGQLNTYKTYFDSPVHDLHEHVALIVAHTGANHRGITITAEDLFAHRNDILLAIEVPYERSIAAAHWVLCKEMAKDGINFTLDGVGADEQLGGYRIFQTSLAAFQRGEYVPGLAFVGASRPPESFNREADLDSLYTWLTPPARAKAIASIYAEREDVIDSFAQMCRYHMQRGALPMLLRYNRDIGRAFGQESSSPFMDHQLVEFSIGLRDELKMANGCSKYALRRAVEDLVPEKIVKHDNKTSYLDIEIAWLSGPGLTQLRADVAEAVALLPTLLATEEQHNAETLDRITILRMWRIACLGVWAKLYRISA